MTTTTANPGNAFVSVFELGELGDGGAIVGVKDCIDIAGMPTRGGSRALAGAAPATAHADVVRLLLDAGWKIVGKTNMHELAYGMTGVNAWTGTPRNPQDGALIPGGSSSGSAAAVGAGLVDMALGSDTGGSIRMPAACCGVIGFKPSFGRVSRAGAHPRHSTLDCVGPLARTMDMLIAAMAVIAPDFNLGAARQEQRRARVRLVDCGGDPAIAQAVELAVARAGWQVDGVGLPGMAHAFEAGMVLINAETSRAFGHLAGRGELSADVEKRLTLAAATTAAQRDKAERVREAFTAEVDRALTHADALVLPTLPRLPPTLAEVEAGLPVLAMSALIRPFNLSGHPALTLPLPLAGGKLKAGLQLVGRKGEDEKICALALHLERALRATT
ncbi:amidase [Pseudoduganella namucuonensis]|uniref:Amidase n=1 Tax=Pseudoduganella namucuonensis TaxID=1035707 RepID=A0A1I7LZL9_9BURK|nr:amidase [Pseudoduganella namucuonensis]SFV15096.1 amidase [Pseudoduganella namucuonensis]